ncbi:hypothetical protein C8A05DRAFT_15354 [Staphylotrichum tortipilum]|uniref:Uncharacterized protein n=1 Tax=Staphylotrichum tortipilum TaxID=2831512 RepID=A0AAN6MKL5_9PEZI|nr:hypothetical protein C8A05DRAFT_15354 [Staphylotrichum longicolle]
MAHELPIRTSNGGQPDAGILRLPTELISAICCMLCFHCRGGRVVDATSKAVTAAYEDQMAISALSRCSRGLRDKAQPILFHWYHDLEEEDYGRQQRHLERFVEAIIRKPHLAASVKALAFYQPTLSSSHSHLSYAQARARRTYEVDRIFRPTAISLGPGHLARRANSSQPALHVELRDLAIALCPALSQLCFHDIPIPAEDEAPEYNWTTWSYPLPSLTTLVFPGTRTRIRRKEATYHIREATYLLRHAPSLHTLIAPDCGGAGGGRRHLFLDHHHDNDDDDDDEAWDVGPLPALRTLSLNGIGMTVLARILRCCPALQDLEYLDEPASERVWVVLDPARDLGHLRGTLRRLCYSDGNNNGVFFYCGARHDDGPGMAPDGLGFAGFGVLEVLEIEQFLLYGPVFAPSDSRFPGNGVCLRETTGENFLVKLPASLRRLRVGAVIYWPAMYRDLLALVEQQCARFPRLEAVAVEVYRAPPRYQAEHLAGVFAAAGVAFSVARARSPRAALSGLLPARPGRREIVPLSMVYPESDYSESYYSESVSSDSEESGESLPWQ